MDAALRSIVDKYQSVQHVHTCMFNSVSRVDTLTNIRTNQRQRTKVGDDSRSAVLSERWWIFPIFAAIIHSIHWFWWAGDGFGHRVALAPSSELFVFVRADRSVAPPTLAVHLPPCR